MSSIADLSTPTTVLPPSTVGVVWFDVSFADQAAIPHAVEQQVTVDLPLEYASVFAAATTGGRAEVDLRPPVVIGPPLRGSGWLAAGSCCDGPHRRALQSVTWQLYLSQRFAIDFNLLDAHWRIAAGELSVNTNHAGYGQPVFAVAEATVESAVAGIPDQIEGDHYAVTVENVTGNSVILDLGDAHFAFYAHLRPGTVTVRPGQHVQRGQQIGELGNSGSSHSAHLHFQVMDGPSVLTSDGLPYAFDLTGHGPALAELEERYEAGQPLPIDTSGAGPRRDALPLGSDELTFPGREQLP
jgi:murein DD-endopeptidase MepM/ murein hydrolase activator NlpD